MSVPQDEAALRQHLRRILSDRFGFPSFRPCQEDACVAVLQKKDTLVLLPTGSGKTMCYLVPSLYFAEHAENGGAQHAAGGGESSQGGFCIVITPLLALLQDQLARCEEADVVARSWSSEVPESKKCSIERDLRSDDPGFNVLFTTPGMRKGGWRRGEKYIAFIFGYKRGK